MSLRKLTKLVPPPPEPNEPGTSAQWETLQKELGIELPEDYRGFIDRYGTGTLAGFLFIYNPFASDDSLNLVAQLRDQAAQYNGLHQDDEERYPFPMYPALPGLIPWGGDTNGNRYFWVAKTGLKGSSWPVTIDESGEGFQDFQGGFAAFVVALLKGQLDFTSVEFEEGELSFAPAKSGFADSSTAALDLAIDNSDVAALRKLVKKGGNLNARNGAGESLLFAAARKSVELTSVLVHAGADLNATNDDGATPLFGAVYGYQDEVLEYLLQLGADPNRPKNNGDTPIFAAIPNGRLTAIEILAKYPDTLTTTNKGNLTPLAFAKKKKHWAPAVETLKRVGAKK
jgi:Ankyrin repeats (3 copies)/SMI1 / KNR4 family (SUKH-1)/Ankyrin repeat